MTQRNHVIYKIKCSGCNGCYIGKTERCLITRTTEHGTKETNLCLNISLNVNCLKIVVGCIPFLHYSMKMNMKISLWHYISLMPFYKIMRY